MANEKITQLTELTTPADVDIVPIVDDPSVSPITKKLSWSNIKATLKTYFDTLYSTAVKATGAEINTGTDDAKFATAKAIKDSIIFNLPEGVMYNGKIVPTVDGSGNLTVALKTLADGDPSSTDPVYVRIGGVVRTITSALSDWKGTTINYGNAASTELTGKEIDWFVYLQWDSNSSAVKIGWSRIPFGKLTSDFNLVSYANEKVILGNVDYAATTDTVVNIGRFAATLTNAGGGVYTWSVPTFTASNLIQRPIYETRALLFNPTLTWDGTAPTGGTRLNYYYQIIRDKIIIKCSGYGMSAGTSNTSLGITVPFASLYGLSGIPIFLANVSSNINTPNLTTSSLAYNSGAYLSLKFSSINATAFNVDGWYWI